MNECLRPNMPLQLCEPGRNTLPLLHLRLPLLQEELQVNPGDEGPLHHHWRDWKPQQLINKGWYNIGDDASKTIVPTYEIQVIFKFSIVEKVILWLWWLCDRNQSGVILICFLEWDLMQINGACLVNMRNCAAINWSSEEWGYL